RQARAAVEAGYSQQQFEETLLEQIQRLANAPRAPREIIIDAAHAGPPPPRVEAASRRIVQAAGRRFYGMARLSSVVPQAIGHLRRNGMARGWNTLRWLGSSSWSLARLQQRLRRS